MSDTTTIKPNGRAAIAKPVGVSGVVSHGGILYHDDYDSAWKGYKRDDTIRHMLDDPLIGAVLGGVEFLVRRVKWHVAPPDDSPEADEVATFVQTCLDDAEEHWPGDTLAKVLTYLGWGWSCCEIVFKRRNGITGTPPSRFDDGKIGWHRWALRPQATRYGWEFDGDDPTALIQQDPQTFKRIPIPLDKCLLFRYASRDNSPEGSTPLRVAFNAWYNKTKLQRIALIGMERDLAGFPIYYLPAKHIVDNDETYQAAQTIATNIRNDAQAGAVIAGDRDDTGNRLHELVLLSTGGQKSFDPVPYIQHFANEIVTVFLANVMRTGQDATGSYALAETQGGLFQQAIGAHLDTISQTITEQAIWPLCRLNGIPPDLWPTLEHGDIESADLATTGKYYTDLAAAGLLVVTPELTHFLHEIAGFPVPTVEELKQRQVEAETMAREAAQQAQTGAVLESDGETPSDGQDDDATDGQKLSETVIISDGDMADAVTWFKETFPEIAEVID